MSDHPKMTVLLTISVIAAALFAGIFYLGRTPHRAVDKARTIDAFIPANKTQ